MLEFLDRWSEQNNGANARDLFRRLLCAWYLMNTLLLLPYHREIWGPDGFFLREQHPAHSLFWRLADVLSYRGFEGFYPLVLAAQIALLVACVLGRTHWLRTLVTWLLCTNVYYASGPANDGGNNLAQLLLLYVVLSDFGLTDGGGFFSRLRRSFGNAAYLLAKVQVCIVYFTAVVLKLQGPLWQKGMTLFYLSQSETYGSPIMALLAHWSPLATTIATYGVLIFQIIFPFQIWNARLRPALVCCGVALHLGIAFGMGLFTFGTVMIVSYALWLDETHAAQALAWLKGAYARGRSAIQLSAASSLRRVTSSP